MSYKTIDGLMRHLRASGIHISGAQQKIQLRNTGYFHGYKGYRFCKKGKNGRVLIPFSDYKEIYATIQYDNKLKALFYDKIMFIETAVKNIALESILIHTNSESIQLFFDKVVSGYKNAAPGSTVKNKKILQQNKLELQKRIHSNIFYAYKTNNNKITHFYNHPNRSEVPVWALFEILMMGDFGFLLSCLTVAIRNDISRNLGLNVASDTNRELIYKYIYTLKDLRNAIAHNDIIFDTRFRKIEVTKAMQQCLRHEIQLPYINFKTIGDYVLLMCYYLKILHVSKTELKAFIRRFEKICKEYEEAVSPQVSSLALHPDQPARMAALKKYI